MCQFSVLCDLRCLKLFEVLAPDMEVTLTTNYSFHDVIALNDHVLSTRRHWTTSKSQKGTFLWNRNMSLLLCIHAPSIKKTSETFVNISLHEPKISSKAIPNNNALSLFGSLAFTIKENITNIKIRRHYITQIYGRGNCFITLRKRIHSVLLQFNCNKNLHLDMS